MARKRRATPIDIPKLPNTDELPVLQDTATYFQPDPEPEPKKKKSKGAGAVVVHHVVTFLQILMVLGLGIWAYLTFKDVDFFSSRQDARVSALEPYAASAQVARVRGALEVYRALNDEYPRQLQSLVDENILLRDDLLYPLGRTFDYERRADEYTLKQSELVVGTAENAAE